MGAGQEVIDQIDKVVDQARSLGTQVEQRER